MRRGRSVSIHDPKGVAQGASRVAGGMLAPLAELEQSPPALVQLGLASLRLYPEFIAELGPCGYRTEGTLLVALHRDHGALLERHAALLEAHDLPAEWLDGSRLRALEPNLSPRAIGALKVEDLQIEPQRFTAALERALRAGGARFERVEAELTVVAAGAHSNEACPELHLPLRPVRGQVVRLRGAPLVDHVLRTEEVYVVPRGDGRLFLGASSEEVGFDPRPRAGVVFDLLREAARVLPDVVELDFVDTATGYRPALRDHLPAIGALREDLWVATGHYRNGILLAPITARLLLDAIEGTPSPTLQPFDPLRFEEARP